MGSKIDDLEKSVTELMNQAGVESQPPPSDNNTVAKSTSSKGNTKN